MGQVRTAYGPKIKIKRRKIKNLEWCNCLRQGEGTVNNVLSVHHTVLKVLVLK